MHRFLRIAYEAAQSHLYEPDLEYKLCAVIVRGGKILSTGFNGRAWTPLTERYRTTEHCFTIHAEIDAIVSNRRKIRFEGSKIYVVRLRQDGSVGTAKPCIMCQHVLHNYGIKKAIFTIQDFPFVDSMKVENPASK